MLKYWLTIAITTGFVQMLPFRSVAQQRAHPVSRLSPHVLRSSFSANSFSILVRDTTEFRSWLQRHLPAAVLEPQKAFQNLFKISTLSSNDLQKLQQAPQVQFIETTERRAFPENEISGFDFGLNSTCAVHHVYPSLTGDGLRISVKENAFDKNDIDFMGRVYDMDHIPDTSDLHATTMATIIAGAGNSSPDGKGIAWKSTLAFSDFINLLPDPTTELLSNRISVQNHSYGVGVENYYGIEAHAYDQQCAQYPAILHVFSAGNSGNLPDVSGLYAGITGYANLTGQFKTSKNTLTVGGVDERGEITPLSSRGPAFDGRVKPEIVAFGKGGTSEASAIVSGISLLAQQAYQNIMDSLPPSALVKAALINSADDAGRPEVDYEYGFGCADALGAIRTLSEQRFFIGDIVEGDEKLFQVNLPPDIYRIKVTVVWNDPEAVAGSEKALINDLDLELTAESGLTYRPWVLSAYPHLDSLKKVARRAADHTNNVEQITVTQPSAGDYAIRVKGFNVEGAQSFSVVYEAENGFEWIYPTASDAINAGQRFFIRWKWRRPAAIGRAEWTIAGSDQWSPIGDVNLSQEFLEWSGPDINAVIQIRMVTENENLESETFVVSHPIDPQIGFNCTDDGLMFWSAQDGLDHFQLYSFQGNYLTERTLSSDTVLSFDKNAEPALTFAVAPLIDGRPGVRSRSINFDTAPDACYVTSFLAREIVTDSVLLDLSLATTIGLKSIALERKSGIEFITLQTLSALHSNDLTWYDPLAIPGSNLYRVHLLRDNNEIIYSETEEVFYVRDSDLEFFPNPVLSGEPVNLIVNSDIVEFKMYDLTGRLIRASSLDGQIKTVSTAGIAPGIFVIKVMTQSGKRLSGKLILR